MWLDGAIHIMESSLLYSKFTDFKDDLIQKDSSRNTQNNVCQVDT